MANEKFTVEQVARALRESKGMITTAARSLKCSHQTVRNYIERHPTLKQVKDGEREKLIDHAETKLYEQISDGNITAIIFTLKTVGKTRGYVERAEIAGVSGQPIEVVVTWGNEGNADS